MSWPPSRNGSDGAPWVTTFEIPRIVMITIGTSRIRPSQFVVSPVSRAPRIWSAEMPQIRSSPTRIDSVVPGSSIPKTVAPLFKAGKRKLR